MTTPATTTDTTFETEDPLAGITPLMEDDTFDLGFDLLDDEFGGSASGIEDLYRVKFNAGINENVKFLGLEWEAADGYSLIRAKFENFDGWEDKFGMFVPEERKFTDKNGKEVTSWFPKKMYDANSMPIEDDANSRQRKSGGVPVLDENGRMMRNAATKKPIYRNETEAEAKVRKIKDFKQKLNSFLAAFCRENMKDAMTLIASKGRVTGWDDYMNRIMNAIETFCPNYNSIDLRLKLHRKYDKATSNKLSERYFELPDNLMYGLFVEQMCEQDKSVITITAGEEKGRIAAPTALAPTAGIQGPGGPSAGPGLPASPAMGMGATGLPSAIATTAMPGLPKQ